jgi:hypothetical protein
MEQQRNKLQRVAVQYADFIMRIIKWDSLSDKSKNILLFIGIIFVNIAFIAFIVIGFVILSKMPGYFIAGVLGYFFLKGILTKEKKSR